MERRRLLGVMLVLGLVFGVSSYGLAGEKGLSACWPVDEESIPVYKGYYIGEIMPTPKKVEYKDNYLPIIDLRKKKAKACIVIGEEATIPEKTSALEVRSRIKYLAGEDIPQIDILKDTDNYLDYEVVIAIGKPATNKLIDRYCNKYKVRAPEKKEGYIIRIVRDKGKSIVLCAGNDDAGVYFSAQSLNQLFTERGRYLSLREVSVTDWPSFPIRNAWVCRSSFWVAKLHEWAGMFKLNSLGVGSLTKGMWRAPTAEYKNLVKDACLYAKDRGLDVMPCINPYVVEDRPDLPWPLPVLAVPSFKIKPIKISDPADIESLIKICKITLDNGGRKILLAFDDYLPVDEEGRYVLPYQEDREKFNSLGNAHAYLVNEVHKRLKKDYPDYEMVVCPVYYWLNYHMGPQKDADEYLNELGKKVSPDVMIIWTGPEVRSHVITREEVLRCSELIRRKPFYWDNTIYDYHSPPEYLFDSYKPQYPKGFDRMSSGIHFNGFYKVGGINQLDYAWNLDTYDPEISLKKALAIVGGEDMVDTLISFRDNYFRMKGKLHGDFSQFKKRFKELKRNMERIEVKIKDKALVKKLKGKYKSCYLYEVRMKENINSLSEFKEEFKKIKGNLKVIKDELKDKALARELKEKYEKSYWVGVKEFIRASAIDSGYFSPAWKKDLAFCEKTAEKEGFKDIDENIKEIRDSLKGECKEYYWYGVRMKENINSLSEFKEEFKKIKGNFKVIKDELKDEALVKELKEKYEECYWDGVREFIGASVIDNGYLYPISLTWKEDLAFCKKTARESGFKDIDKKIEEIKDSLKETLKLKRYKVVSLENKYIRVDIIPGLGGRIHRMVDKRKGINYLYSPAIKVLSNYQRDYGGYEEYSTNGYHSPGWNEEYKYEIIKEVGERKIKLSCLLSNEYLLTRVISLKDDVRELKINSTLKNTSSQARKSRLRVHPTFATGNLKDNVLYLSSGENKIKKYPLEVRFGCQSYFKGGDLPRGFWLVANEKENTCILNSFKESEVEVCYLWESKKSNVYTLELFSRVKDLNPGESLTIHHKYVLLDDVSESLGRYEIE